MKIWVNSSEISLNNNDFLASGGEGDVYLKGNICYKIFHNKKVIPEGKIKELSTITNKNIITPQNLIYNNKNDYIGFSMPAIKDSYILCQLFTKSFRDRCSLNNKTICDLVLQLRNMIEHCHQNNILMVDINELNFLVDKSFKEVYAIDTTTYQTLHYPATAIMDSIRDRHSPHLKFTEGTDWFSFGILSCQMFLSIHPYKGKHPTIKSYDERMKKNVSIFNKSVSIPAVCYPFDVIPEVYLHWFKAVFEDGKRVSPPKDLQNVINIITKVKNIIGTNNFDIEELGNYLGNIIEVIYSSPKIVLTTQELLIEKTKINNIKTDTKFICLHKTNTVIGANIENRKLILNNLTLRIPVKIDLNINDIMTYDNRLYVKTDANVLEIKFMEMGKNIIASTSIIANTLEYASKCYHGLVIQNLLGACYVSLFPKENEHYQVHIKELDKYKIIDAKYESNVLIIVGFLNGKYDKFIMRMDGSHSSYDMRVEKDISYTGINFTVLDNGICVHINEEEHLELFSSKKDSKSIKVISDPVISNDLKLFKNGSSVLFAKENKLFSIKMKS